jgi:hypothetical protein
MHWRIGKRRKDEDETLSDEARNRQSTVSHGGDNAVAKHEAESSSVGFHRCDAMGRVSKNRRQRKPADPE